MTIQSKQFSGADSVFHDGLHPGAGALTGSRAANPGKRPVTNTPATDEWVNEGGAVEPRQDAAPEDAPPPPRRSPGRAKTESPEWCRERAAADLVMAGEMGTANGRLRFEHSAVTWTVRADLLQRLKDGSEARRIAAAALWPETSPSADRRRILTDAEELTHVRL